MSETNDLITSAEDLDTQVPLEEAEEATEVAEPVDTETAEEEVNQEDTASEEGEEAPSEPQFSEAELEEIISLGSRVRDYQKTHPGYDPIKIHGEYTRNSMELANLKNASKTREQEATPDPALNLEGIATEDIALVEKILKAKGYVHKSDLQKQNYEQVKKSEINTFLETHPEYKPGSSGGDQLWDGLLQEFNLYKMPTDPKQIGDLLKRAHANASGSQLAIDPKQAAKFLAQKRVNKTNQATGSGKAGAAPEVAPKGVPEAALKHLKGISPEELEELFKD